LDGATQSQASDVITRLATIAINILPVNDPPEAHDDLAATDRNTSLTLDVLRNDTDPDGDALEVIRVSQGQHGAASRAFGGAVIYTPTAGYTGADTFRYQIQDSRGSTSTAAVHIYVNAVNAAPVFASTPATQAMPGAPYAYTIVTTDADAGDRRLIAALDLPTWLTLADAGDGTAALSGLPDATEQGVYHITLQVRDGGGAWSVQAFTLSVGAPGKQIYLPVVMR